METISTPENIPSIKGVTNVSPYNTHGTRTKLQKDIYSRELVRLQIELVKFEEWIKATGKKVLVLFEGRDAAGKGGVIKRITQRVNPKVCRVVALPAPTEREKTQWYFQRYVAHLPAVGELVLFDRSWYNRAGVEHVMGFCTLREYHEFLYSCPIFERMLVRSGIILVKYWFSISDAEQKRRFQKRLDDPLKRWKISSMDLQSRIHWEEYTRAKEVMFERTHITQAPWHVVPADDKRRARLNCISHLLSVCDYKDVTRCDIQLPSRKRHHEYVRHAVPADTIIPQKY